MGLRGGKRSAWLWSTEAELGTIKLLAAKPKHKFYSTCGRDELPTFKAKSSPRARRPPSRQDNGGNGLQ